MLTDFLVVALWISGGNGLPIFSASFSKGSFYNMGCELLGAVFIKLDLSSHVRCAKYFPRTVELNSFAHKSI